MDCADICNATASVLSRHTGYDADITRAILLRANLRSLPQLVLSERQPFSPAVRSV